MWDVRISTAALRQLADAAQAELDRGVDRAVELAVREGAEEAHDRHPYTNRTGNLETSTVGKMTGPAKGVIEATEHYASYVNRKPRFNFMRRAEVRAEEVLVAETNAAAARAAAILSRK